MILGLLKRYVLSKVVLAALLAVTAWQGWSLISPSPARAPAPAAASASPEPGLGGSIRAASLVKRVLIWLALAALLPLLLIPLIKRLLEKNSNAVNFALLAGLTLIDLAAAFVLAGFELFSWLPALMILAAGAAGAVYNYWLCSALERLRK